MDVWILGTEIIVKYFPFPRWVHAKFLQEPKKLFGKYVRALGSKVLARGAGATLGIGHSDCVTVQ